VFCGCSLPDTVSDVCQECLKAMNEGVDPKEEEATR